MLIGGSKGEDVGGCAVEGGLVPCAPRVEDTALNGQQAIEAGEHERGAFGVVLFKKGQQFKWNAAGTDEIAGDAGLVEGPKPFAEGGGIVLPVDARRDFQQSRHVGAEQTVGFHGQGCESAARALKPAGGVAAGSDDFGPQGLLLHIVEKQASVKLALLPFRAGEAAPLDDIGCGPRFEALCASSAMEAGSDGSRGAIAGGDHKTASAQPCVQFSDGNGPHFRVIRCQARRVPQQGSQGAGYRDRGHLRLFSDAVVHWGVIRSLVCCTLLAGLMLAGCHSDQKTGTPSAGQSAYKTYKLRGKVVSTNAATSEVTVDHEAIPGFMDAMTMPYKLKDANILSELHPGDRITADLLVSQSDDADIVLDHIVVVGQAKPDYKPKVSYHVPAPGDAVPDFKLRNQDGKTIHTDQFRGKELLITFIYTRCPLPNFCPLVTRNFARIDKQLAVTPALYSRTHLLCVSFDPENDTPERLRAYGATYMGSDDKSAFAHWDFAVPEKTELKKMAQYFDVGFSTAADNSITHTLSTTLIDSKGKVVKFYPGNEWTAEQVLADVKQSAGA